jgi:hypothetical protein
MSHIQNEGIKVKANGTVRRSADGTVVVRIKGATHVAELPGVVCLNPKAPEPSRRYEKWFTKKQIFLATQYDQAVSEHLSGPDTVVLGMNGYSLLTDQQCLAWGVKPGAYEAACRRLLREVYSALNEAFPGIDVRFAHGASDTGVDRAVIEVAKELNRPQLGHSCPEFMFYVSDGDLVPVYVAASQEDYANSFIRSLQILIAANGRQQAFSIDIDAAFKMLRSVILVNVLKSISTTGGPPAIGADGRIEDAVAAFEHLVHAVGQRMGILAVDPYQQLVDHIREVTISIARTLLSPERAF